MTLGTCPSSLVHVVDPNPTTMYFPHSDKPVKRRLVIRNTTNYAYVIKLIQSDRSVIMLQSRKMLLAPGIFATTTVKVDPTAVDLLDYASHKIRIYARPITLDNYYSLQDWMNDDGMWTVKQRVVTLTIRISREYSTILDIPGDAAAVEATIESCPDPGLDDDTKTANDIDCDTMTAAPIEAADGIALLRANKVSVGGWSVAAVAEWLGLKAAV